MVKEIHLHQLWIDLAQEFIFFGEINKAKTLLDFAHLTMQEYLMMAKI